MARNRVVCDFSGFRDYMARLDELGNDDAMKRGVEAGLKASKQYVNTEVKKVISKSNLPAHGKYSSGITAESLDKNFNVDWEGPQGVIKIGFDFFSYTDNISCLVVIKSAGTYNLFDVLNLCTCKVIKSFIFTEKLGSNKIYSCIRALCRKPCRNK